MLVARNLDVTVNIRIIPHLKATGQCVSTAAGSRSSWIMVMFRPLPSLLPTAAGVGQMMPSPTWN